MRIGVIGATGNLGQRVVAEAVGRGHQVRAFTRGLGNAAAVIDEAELPRHVQRRFTLGY